MKVMIVEKDRYLVQQIVSGLLQESSIVFSVAYTGNDFLFKYDDNADLDLIILGLELGDIESTKIIDSVRQYSLVPIIVIGKESQEDSMIRAIQHGADDFIFREEIESKHNIMPRIRKNVVTRNVRFDHRNKSKDMDLDLTHNLLHINGRDVTLTNTEMQIIMILSQNIDHVVSYRHIAQHVWGELATNYMNPIRVHIHNIRNKIETDPCNPAIITNESVIGYRMHSHVNMT